MQFDLSNITDAQQKEYSFLSNKRKQQLLFIEKEKKVDSEKSDTYVSRRAQSALENAKNKLKYAKDEYEKAVEKHEATIALQEEIIFQENNKKNPNVTRALLDVEEIDKKILALGLPVRKSGVSSLPPVTVSKVIEEPSQEDQEYEEAKQSFFSEEKEPEGRSLWVQETFEKQYVTKPKHEEVSDGAFERWAAANRQEQSSFRQDTPSFPPTISNTKTKKPVKMTYSQMQRLKELQSH